MTQSSRFCLPSTPRWYAEVFQFVEADVFQFVERPDLSNRIHPAYTAHHAKYRILHTQQFYETAINAAIFGEVTIKDLQPFQVDSQQIE